MTELRPEDLRIGCWYHSVRFNKPVQLTELDFYTLVCSADGASISSYISSMFTPIPLSEDWLKDFGFEYKITHVRSGAKVVTWDGGWIYDLEKSKQEGKWVFRYDGIGLCVIEYVHQLQNLYHSLTGAELKDRG